MNATEQQWGPSRHRPNIAFDVLASPGGPEALDGILPGLPTDFPASVLVVQLPCPDQPGLLADNRSRHTVLMVKQTGYGDVLHPSNGFTHVPDRHRLVRPDGTVSQAPRVRFVCLLYDFAFALRTLAGVLGGW